MNVKARLVKNFQKLAGINSISGEEAVLREYIIFRLTRKGIAVRVDLAGNLFVPRPKAKMLLTAHLDTVEPGRGIKASEVDGRLISDGTTIVGGDNKAGLALILSLFENLSASELDRTELLFTVNEEKGLIGIRNFETELLNSKFGISFDKSGEKFGEYIGVGGNQAEIFNIILSGKANHSARPVPELNPINAFLDIFSDMRPGFIDIDTTFNIGNITGFKQENSTPQELIIKGDIRSRNKRKVEDFYRNLQIRIEKYSGKVQIGIKRELVSQQYRLNNKTPGYATLVKVMAKLGYVPVIESAKSITDASILSANGIPTYLLSCGVFNAHSVSEYVEISEMEKAYAFLSQLVKEVNIND